MRPSPALLIWTLLMATGWAAPAQAKADPSPGAERIIIFFAWDRPVIDGDAATRLDTLVASLKPGVALELTGHADRSGPSASNLRSGRARAEAVRAFLAARGVPEAAMTVASHGESRPLIATADGVREPQNRRVEILIERPAGN